MLGKSKQSDYPITKKFISSLKIKTSYWHLPKQIDFLKPEEVGKRKVADSFVPLRNDSSVYPCRLCSFWTLDNNKHSPFIRTCQKTKPPWRGP